MTEPAIEVVELSRALGSADARAVILTEGNVSARADDGIFLVTSSGSALADLATTEVVAVRTAPVLDFVRSTVAAVPTELTGEMLAAAVVAETDPAPARPSIETVLHAVAYDRTPARFVGHTHPTPVVGLACSIAAPEVFHRPAFPDEVVICGPAYATVPYAPPGPLLARAFGQALDAYTERYGEPPRAVILENHGLVALGSTAAEVLAVTAMTVKGAEIRVAALAAGDFRPLSADSVEALVVRDDEADRRALLVAEEASGAG